MERASSRRRSRRAGRYRRSADGSSRPRPVTSGNCPVIDWLLFVGTTDGISWYRNSAKLPWEHPSEHLRRSPLKYVGNVKTPTMLLTGVKDLRTPISQTEEFYAALKVLCVPTAMRRFTDEWHGTSSKPSSFLRTQLYLRHWFERYMTDDAIPKQQQRAQRAAVTETAARQYRAASGRPRRMLCCYRAVMAAP